MHWERITENLPPDFWPKTGLFVLVVVIIIVSIRAFQRSNKILLAIGIFVGGGVLMANWIWNRNEPAFFTPLVNVLSNFFPSQGETKKEAGDFEKSRGVKATEQKKAPEKK